MLVSRLGFVVALAVSMPLLGGCSLIVGSKLDDKDDGPGDPDGGTDSSVDGDIDGDVPVDCEGQPNETPCGTSAFCFNDACVPSECGDGLIVESLGEECEEDGGPNGDDADGCTDVCRFTCTDNDDCAFGDECNGIETCDEDHVCQPGEPQGNGEPCTAYDGSDGTCSGTVCMPESCGNGLLDDNEECDPNIDGTVEGSCTALCQWTCEDSTECSVDACNPDSCDTENHLCVDEPVEDCDDVDVDSLCQTTGCVAGACPVSFLDDTDGDGFSGIACEDEGLYEGPTCDTNKDNYPGARERCDGVDNDCDTEVDEDTESVNWYQDNDGDGYGDADTKVSDCAAPGDDYVLNGEDCNDKVTAVNPGQITYAQNPIIAKCTLDGSQSTTCWDYNCNGDVEVRYEPLGDCSSSDCNLLIGGTSKRRGYYKPVDCGDVGDLYACSGTIFNCNPVKVESNVPQGCR